MKKYIIIDSLLTIILLLGIIQIFYNYKSEFSGINTEISEIEKEIDKIPYSDGLFPDIESLQNYSNIKCSYYKTKKITRNILISERITIHLEYSEEKYKEEKEKIINNTIFLITPEYHSQKYSLLNNKIYYHNYQILIAPNMSLNSNDVVLNSDKKIINNDYYMDDRSFMLVCFNDDKFMINYLCGYYLEPVSSFKFSENETIDGQIYNLIRDFYWYN